MSAAAMFQPMLTAPQTAVHGEGSAFHAALIRLRDYIARRAEELAFGDADLAADLAQEATVHLWELDPSRYGEEDQLYLRRSIMNRMIDLARAERAEQERRVELWDVAPEMYQPD